MNITEEKKTGKRIKERAQGRTVGTGKIVKRE
jgi:hypothetical protein